MPWQEYLIIQEILHSPAVIKYKNIILLYIVSTRKRFFNPSWTDVFSKLLWPGVGGGQLGLVNKSSNVYRYVYTMISDKFTTYLRYVYTILEDMFTKCLGTFLNHVSSNHYAIFREIVIKCFEDTFTQSLKTCLHKV